MFSSITARLIVSLTVVTTVVWCAAAAYSTYISRSELDESFDRTLVEAAHHLLPLAAYDLMGHERLDTRGEHELAEAKGESLSYQIRDATGKIVLRAHDAPMVPYDLGVRPGFSTVGKYRLFTETDPVTGLTITAAETSEGRAEVVSGATRAMLLPLAGLIPLNILAIWLIVRATMRRVRRLGVAIAARSSRNLAPLDISDQPVELKPLALAVARLVERLSAALDAERAFAANSAHELRTPIAGALAQTQRLIAELGDAKDRRRARGVETTLKRLAMLTEKLMQLARVDAGVGLSASEIDLVPALDLVVADCAHRLEAPERLVYTRAKDARLFARTDMDAFAIAVRNLIDNAIGHGAADATIEVRLEPGGVLRVINGGPPVRPDVLAGLKRRFMRGETTSAGTGLGLAIAETIMERTSGRLDLFSPAPGRSDGFEARLTVNEQAGSSPIRREPGRGGGGAIEQERVSQTERSTEPSTE